MKPKSILKLCLTAACAATAALALAACGDHTHTYAEAWTFDETSHWHSATCGHDAKENKSAHDFRKTVVEPTSSQKGYTLYTCACGYSYTENETAPTPAGSEYTFDETTHSKDGVTAAHEFTESVVAPTCTSAGYTKHSCVCGYWYADTPTEPIDHTTDEGVFGHDAAMHWHPCLVCGMPVSSEAHAAVERTQPATCEKDGSVSLVCTVCGYTLQETVLPAGHTFGDELASNEFEHWYVATCSHSDAKGSVEDHFFEGDSTTCAFCGKTVSPRLGFKRTAAGDGYIVTGVGSFKGTEIVIPDTYNNKPVVEIAEKAFRNVEVTSLTLGENVKKIGKEAFRGAQISALVLPEALESIGAKAFAETNISQVELKGALETMGQAAFGDCTSLTTVTISTAKPVSLPVSLFEGCTALEEVNGEGKVKEVGDLAFSGCTGLKTLDLSVCEKLGFSALGGCTLLKPAGLPLLTSADEYALSGCTMTEIALPLLKSVPARLFADCTALATVNLAAAESLGAFAFEGCTALTTVTASKVVSIGEEAFSGCAQLEHLTVSENIARVERGAFEGTKLIQEESGAKYVGNILVGGTGSIAVKAGTVLIMDAAFESRTDAGNTALTGVTLADSVRYIGANAFRGCTKLTTIDLKKVTQIGANAFRASGLTSVTVPSTVENVGENAFYDCMSLASVNVSAKRIGAFAFSFTGVGRDLQNPEKQRPSGVKLASLTFGEGVESIGSNAFQYATLSSVILPDSLVSIGRYAFAHTDLETVTIPANVTFIGAYAFYKAPLTSVTFRQKTGWSAGERRMSVGTAKTNATNLTDTTKYCTYDWSREATV